MATKFEGGESFLRSRGSPRHSNSASAAASSKGGEAGAGEQRSKNNALPSLSALLSANDISPRVQHHLVRVYATLLLAVACAAAGAAADSFLHVGGMLTTLAALATMAALAATPASPSTLARRTRLLTLFSALQGASLGPLISLAAAVDPSLIAVAFVGASLVFACFTAAALLTRRRSMLALGGALSTAVSSFLWLRVAALLLPRSAWLLRALELELYLGVFLFSGFILFDTQLIIEKASAGERAGGGGGDDHVAHALDLFVDAAALFARLLAILVRHAAQREAGGDRRDRRRRAGVAGGGGGAQAAARSGRRA